MITDNTPLEVFELQGVPILVKREDMCCPYPGPSFSKMRGVAAHIKNRPESVIGVLDTLHSKAGWCVSYVCRSLGKQAVNYWPRYKADPATGLVRPQQIEAEKNGAKMFAIKAGRSAILYHAAKKHLHAQFPGSYLMPNALKLPESITENAKEVELMCRTRNVPPAGTLVISISSGTVASGVLRGFKQAGLLDSYQVYLHMGYSRSETAARAYIEAACGFPLGSNVTFVDEGYGYADAVDFPCPFPANPHYDLKAWSWLASPGVLDKGRFSGPILFWNIGA